MNRQTYLNSEWEKYSFFPDDFAVCGLLKDLFHEGDQMTLVLNGQNHRIKISEQKKLDYRFLKKNDDVAITKHGQVILLVPRSDDFEDLSGINPQLQWLWSRFLQGVRNYFNEQNFLELNTSSLVTNPGPEPTIEVFKTEWIQGSKRKDLFLSTSPEIEIKKQLVSLARLQDKPKVFEITKSYRNSEWTERHRPEFFILEWYRTYEDLNSLKVDIQKMVEQLSRFLKDEVSLKKWSYKIAAPEGVASISFKDFFKQNFQFDFQPQTNFESLMALAQELKIDTHSAENFDDLFFLIYMHKVEHQWPQDQLFFIEKYPPSQAALARLDQQGWGERFEFYWKGFEIANAFCELNDPEIQSERLKKDLQEKIRLGKIEIPYDEEFIQSLKKGMPPTSGVALGLERLFMALLGIQEFKDLKLAHIKS